jgi:putative transposase
MNRSLALRKDQTMKRKRHTEEQIIAIPKEHEAGVKTAELCRKHGISEASSTTGRPSMAALRAPRPSA